MEELRLLRKQVREYAEDYIGAFWDGDVPAPSGGDCWLCLFEMGDSTEHILSHISPGEERYYVPCLLSKAAKRFGVSQAAQHVLAVAWNPVEAEERGLSLDRERGGYGGIVSGQLTKALRRLLYEKLGTAS